MNPQKRISDDSANEIKNKKQRDSNAVETDDTSASLDSTFVFPYKTEMAKLCRNLDWSKTKLGPTTKWPQSLRTAASICLNNRFPSLVMWGPDLVQIYNEGYCDVLENRHPSALGTPCSETWWDIWDVIAPMFDQVVSTGQSLFLKDYLLHIRNKDGHRGERYFTYSYSPIYIENAKVGGVLNTVTETTDKIFNERQLRTLREVASHTTEATTIQEACRILATTLSTNPKDIFFASIYLGESHSLRLVETVNVEQGTEITPCEVGDTVSYSSANQALFAKALVQVASTDAPLQFDLSSYSTPKSTVWTNAPFDKDPVFTRVCKMLPIASAKHGTTMGVIVIGISPMRPYDESYSSFLRLIAGQTSAVIGNARAHEEERKKAEMLADLDRAKTLFFSNISHEFRTPITLMLGPIEDLILKERATEEKSLLVQLELIHRNALRLLKLVNTLLDFSRIEAGRMEATFEPVDISQVTHDLASVFRSACERVGLDLIVDCPPISEAVFIDNDMYEKIVLNLVSNAYKFCMRGHIAVRVKELGKQAVQISVEDTGTGIPEEEVPRLFERFHRVPESKGRTHEGTGIGLAMVNELVKLHGGTIQVYSKLGQGSIFIVTLPYGTHHLPADRLKEPAKDRRHTYARTAEWWIGSNQAAVARTTSSEESPNKPRVLIVDDNADMREYLQNLLSESYDLEVACDGLHALEIVARKLPELVLTDIMMPKMDGFGLVQKLREDPKTKTIPVIFLSARAGEEARVEGLKLGADDYLTKPFTARELQARIKTHLELYQIRQEAAIRAEAANRAKDHFLAVLSHELRTPLTPALLLAESLAMDDALPDKVRLDLELITKNIKLEVKLIDDLLDVTKITKNKLVLSLKQVNAHTELLHTLNLVKHDANEKQIQLETHFHAHNFHLEADPSRLQQIFWNIVKNAVKFTPENGTILITTRNDEMGMFSVDVKDSGIGIESESLPKIFESFQQGAQSITNQFGGLGLGLSISRALCTMMSGTISVISDGPSTGSTFSVSFPTISFHETPSSPLQSPIETPISPQHILLTEDNKSTALVMTRFLKKLGHEVKTAYCIKEAMEMAASHKFDLVISDVGLPDGSGFDLMRSLHSMYGLRGICVTGYGMEEDIRKSKECGFDIHVVKPVEMQALQSAIGFVVRQIQLRNV